ncbi:MAG TPA: hypothetical protein VKZ71_01160 [Burkholderiaceae bacterium]|nr:hypothetical protein [Burkholderiaceae bacterium]
MSAPCTARHHGLFSSDLTLPSGRRAGYSAACRQRGAGLAGFAVVVMPVLLLGLGSVEIAHWFFTRQAVSLALLEAGRAAVTSHNHPQRIIGAFERTLEPVFGGRQANAWQGAPLQQALATRKKALSAAPWHIDVLSPSDTVWPDFTDPSLHVGAASGRQVINNHYLAEQDARYRARGWPDGRGPVSGQTIFEANTLVMRLRWPHAPRLPLLKPLLRAMGNPAGTDHQRMLAAGYLPIARHITLVMQSHPVRWGNTPDGKVRYQANNPPTRPACRGWLCNAADHNGSAPTPRPIVPPNHGKPADGNTDANNGGHGSPDSNGDSNGNSSGQPGNGSTDDGRPGNNTPGTGDTTPGDGPLPGPDDPACGVVLCCL